MPTTAQNTFPLGRVITLLVLLLGLGLIVLHRPSAPAPPVSSPLARASPPPEIAVELTEQQLAEITEAYESGFDHPDPDGQDPCRRLRLLPHKKLSTWRKQFQRRGFTMQKVRDMLRYGRREVHRHPGKSVSHTRVYDQKGNWIVVDFVDCIIWQIAPYNFK